MNNETFGTYIDHEYPDFYSNLKRRQLYYRPAAPKKAKITFKLVISKLDYTDIHHLHPLTASSVAIFEVTSGLRMEFIYLNYLPWLIGIHK